MLQRVVAKRTDGFSHAGLKAVARSDPSVVPPTLGPFATGASTVTVVTGHSVEPARSAENGGRGRPWPRR